MYVESTFSTIFPPSSDLSRTLFHSGSSWKAFQLAALPFWIVLESFPVGGRGLAAGVRENVDERAALRRLVERRPIGDVPYPVFFKKFRGVLAEAFQQVVELAFVRVVHAKLVHGG